MPSWPRPCARARREIDAAVAFAEASPAPGRAELLTDVI